jgi:SpoVK/Ycf46/Vps4 family AAA+-type ATPase
MTEARPVVAFELPMPAEEDRARHWRALLAQPSDSEASALAAAARLTSGNIRRAAAAASALAALEQRTAISPADLQRACRELRSARLEALATRLPTEGGLERLAVDDATHEELAVLLARCALRERLAASSSGGAPSGVGVRALLAGPSGTGKTWAARLVASSLGKDLYRLEQSATVSKWLGDTEKALHQAFSAAEELDVVLLLDEGDAVMGTRTAIASSNDRHANFQTNALLQIVESYEGILLITTNAAECIDRAFARRMDVVVNFRAPDEWQRYEILRLHLGDEKLDEQWLQEIACRCILNGGQLRNVVMHARLLALQQGGELQAVHLHGALAREYRKIGTSCPVRG